MPTTKQSTTKAAKTAAADTIFRVAAFEVASILKDQPLLMGVIGELRHKGRPVAYNMLGLSALGPAESNLVIDRSWPTQNITPLDVLRSIIARAVNNQEARVQPFERGKDSNVQFPVLAEYDVPGDLAHAVRLSENSALTACPKQLRDFMIEKMQALFTHEQRKRPEPVDLARKIPMLAPFIPKKSIDLKRHDSKTWDNRLYTVSGRDLQLLPR